MSRSTLYILFQGRLGNRLFQLAFGLALQRKYNERHDVRFVIDNNDVFWRQHRFLLLDNQILNRIPFMDNIRLFKEEDVFESPTRVLDKIDQLDCSFHYIMLGYWQSATYFEEYVSREEMMMIGQFIPTPFTKLKIDDNCLLCSMHIRRGDYLSLGHVFHILDEQYYIDAIKTMCAKIQITPARVIVCMFSDSPINPQFKHRIEMETGATLVSMSNRSDRVDFQHMLNIPHHIMANSSFSWWAAYLKTTHGVVVSPSKWFINKMEQDFIKYPAWEKI